MHMNKLNLFGYLSENGNDLNNRDLAVLADWANDQKNVVANPDWKKAYALIREGADLLLRRRARSSVELSELEKSALPTTLGSTDYMALRNQIKDFSSIFYGPHDCPCGCSRQIIRQAMEQGGKAYVLGFVNWDPEPKFIEHPNVPIGDDIITPTRNIRPEV